MSKPKLILFIIRANHKRGGSQIFLQHSTVPPGIGSGDFRMLQQKPVQPFLQNIGVPLLFFRSPQRCRQVFHQLPLVGRFNLMLAVIPIQPRLDEQFIQASRIDRFPLHLQAFQFVQTFGNLRQQIRTLSQVRQIVNRTDGGQCLSGSLFRSQERCQIGQNLFLCERQQQQCRKRFAVKVFTIVSSQHGILTADIPKVMRSARNQQFASLNSVCRSG